MYKQLYCCFVKNNDEITCRLAGSGRIIVCPVPIRGRGRIIRRRPAPSAAARRYVCRRRLGRARLSELPAYRGRAARAGEPAGLHRLGFRPEDVPVLLRLGKEHIYVWEDDEDMLHENDAAEVLRPSGLLSGANELARDVATALAISVLPQPGGPYRSSPLGARRP